MTDPKFDVAIPYQFYNLILTFVTILALLWGMVAIKRVYRMLRVRSAVLSDRLIQIRGLGSYLTYFDGATRSHMDAVVHTRQSMPPVAMEQLNVAAVVKDIEIIGDGYGHYSLEINMESSCKCKVIALFDYNARNFQQLVTHARTEINGNAATDSKLLTVVTGLRVVPVGGSATIFPRFQRDEVCSFECLSEEVGPGARAVHLSLSPTLVSFVQDKIMQPVTADATSKLVIGVMILPVSSSRSAASQPHRLHSGSTRKSSNRVGAAEGIDLETADTLALHTFEMDLDCANDDNASVKSSSDAGSGPDGFISGRNPLNNGRRVTGGNGSGSPTALGSYINADTSEKYEESRGSSAGQSVFASVFVHQVSIPTLRTSTGSSAACGSAPSELTVLDRNLNSYNSLEIFGLASSHRSPTAVSDAAATQSRPAEATPTAAAPTSTGTDTATPRAPTEAPAAAVCCGGCFVAEDCVVCLTDHKEVLLLPCRHLCVCESCLVFIDKCPVCRAAFEEYITIKPSGCPVPATAPAIPALTNGPRSSSDSQQPHSEADTVTPYDTVMNI